VGQDIQITSISSPYLCGGDTISVDYNCVLFTPTGNLFIELSDASGSFAAPAIIATVPAALSGTINGFIPVSITTGIAYRIRVTSSTPFVNGSNNGSDISLFNNTPITLIDNNYTFLAPTGFATYQWYCGQYPVMSPWGSYQSVYGLGCCGFSLAATNPDGCLTRSDTLPGLCIYYIESENPLVGIDTYQQKEFTLYPNPATTTLTIESSVNSPQTIVAIYNTQGQEVYHSTFDVQRSTFDISQFPTGLYYLTLQSNEGVATKKFEVIR
jgi:hypothetical protein